MAENVLLGFEYETLIQPNPDKADFWNLVITTLNKIKNGDYDTICDNEFAELKQKLLTFKPEEYENAIKTYYLYPIDEEQIAMRYSTSDPSYTRVSSPSDAKERIEYAKFRDPLQLLLYRFTLAALFNYAIQKTNMRSLKKYKFKAEKIGGGFCDTFVLDKKNTEALENKSWAVTDDSSVLRIANEPLYKNIEGVTFRRKIISYLRSMEIVSPILTYTDVQEDLETIINNLLTVDRTFIYWNNHRTSNHIHLSYNGFDFRQNPLSIVKICMAWWYIEPLILLFMGNWRRNNDYCTPINSILKSKIEDNEKLKEAFKTINEDNVFDFITQYLFIDRTDQVDENEVVLKEPKYTKRELETGNNILLFHAITDLFQGDLHNRSNRYAALNLINICEGGINTIEIRVKHGSSDGEESKMFMLLLSHFLYTVLSKPCISYMSEEDKNKIFEVNNILRSNPDWTKTIKLVFSKYNTRTKKSDQDKIREVFDIFMSLMELGKENEINKYWKKRLEFILREQLTKRKRDIMENPPLLGGKPNRDSLFMRELNKKGEYSSFGYINYDKIYKGIEKNYKKFGWTKRWGLNKKSSTPKSTNMKMEPILKAPIMSAPIVSVRAGGKMKKKNPKTPKKEK